MSDMTPAESASPPTANAAIDEFYSSRKVLVTGGLGFIGSNLVRALVASGADVRVLDHSWPQPRDNAELLGRVDMIRADIRDAVAVEEAVKGRTIVFNLAGRSGPAASNASPLEDLDINMRGHLTLLDACRGQAPDVKVIFPSSRLVYAPTAQLPVAETAATGPKSIYGIHKLACEHYHLLYHALHGVRSTVLRVTNPYGQFQRSQQNRYGIINWFIQRAVAGQDLTVYGAGDQLRDYVHADDVVRAFLLAGANPQVDGLILNVGGGQPIAFREMAELVVRCAGRGSVRTVEWPADVAQVETGSFVADISLIQGLLQWRPRLDLAEGIAAAVGKHSTRTKPI
jgi:UDP-glucose 4-epimerase